MGRLRAARRAWVPGCYRPEHSAFPGTGLCYGDLLGAEGHAFGYEVDGLDYVIRGSMPEPTESSGAPPGLQLLALGAAWLEERATVSTSMMDDRKQDNAIT